MNTFSKTLLVITAAAVAAGFASASHAQDTLPRSGEITLTMNLVEVGKFGGVNWGAGAPVATANSWIGALTNDAGTGFGHLMTVRCVSYARLAQGVIQSLPGDCVFTDRDGDQLFYQFELGVGHFAGGTRKYAGATGDLTWTAPLNTLQSDYRVVIDEITGTYQLP